MTRGIESLGIRWKEVSKLNCVDSFLEDEEDDGHKDDS